MTIVQERLALKRVKFDQKCRTEGRVDFRSILGTKDEFVTITIGWLIESGQARENL